MCIIVSSPALAQSIQTVTLAEKPDKNGNVWRYYLFETYNGDIYLGVKDIQREFERVYRINKNYEGLTSRNEIELSSYVSRVRVTEDAIYFVSVPE